MRTRQCTTRRTSIHADGPEERDASECKHEYECGYKHKRRCEGECEDECATTCARDDDNGGAEARSVMLSQTNADEEKQDASESDGGETARRPRDEDENKRTLEREEKTDGYEEVGVESTLEREEKTDGYEEDGDDRTLEREEKTDGYEEDGDERTLESEEKTDGYEDDGDERTLEREENMDGYEEDGDESENENKEQQQRQQRQQQQQQRATATTPQPARVVELLLVDEVPVVPWGSLGSPGARECNKSRGNCVNSSKSGKSK